MKNLSDERLEKLLTDYCEAEPEQSFVFDPERKAEKVIPFALYRKQLVAAASLVLVSVLSIALYFSIGNKIDTPIVVAPSPQGATTPSAPKGESGDVNETVPQDGTEAEEKPSGLLQLIESIFTTPTEPRQNGVSPTTVAPTEKGSNSGGKPTEAPSQNSTQSATEKPTVTPTAPPPTQPPTQAAVIPTQPISPPCIETEPPTEGGSSNPGEPEIPPPTEGAEPGYELPGIVIDDSFDVSLRPPYDVVYCKLYDSRGRLLGDSNVYSPQHWAEVAAIRGDSVIVEYQVPEGLFYLSGYYNYVFYDENGRLLTQGQYYYE